MLEVAVEILKAQVIRQFLGFLSRYLPLPQAQLATLGGQGLEAEIWAEIGISHDNGWLIERSRSRGEKLIRAHGYHIHNQLGTFNQILAGCYGENHAVIDGFHLDLCGTFGPATEDFRNVLPLVLNGAGRCLAVTVADQRRNLALEGWPSLCQRALRLFGANADVYQTLLHEQQQIPVRTDLPAFMTPFDPEKAAKREFGLMVEIAELLERQSVRFEIGKMERYVYVSRLKNRPFRMRTYIFRFEKTWHEGAWLRKLPNSWTRSTLHFSNGAAFQEIGSQPKPTVKGIMSTSSVLSELARVVGGETLVEYESLVADRERLQHLLEAIRRADGSRGLEPVAQPSEPQNKNWDDLSDQEKINWLLKALEFKAEHGPNYNGEWKDLLARDFGQYTPELGKSIRAAVARTSGKFRAGFEKRIRHVFHDRAQPYLDRLSKL